jgi:hypothetical protein
MNLDICLLKNKSYDNIEVSRFKNIFQNQFSINSIIELNKKTSNFEKYMLALDEAVSNCAVGVNVSSAELYEVGRCIGGAGNRAIWAYLPSVKDYEKSRHRLEIDVNPWIEKIVENEVKHEVLELLAVIPLSSKIELHSALIEHHNNKDSKCVGNMKPSYFGDFIVQLDYVYDLDGVCSDCKELIDNGILYFLNNRC